MLLAPAADVGTVGLKTASKGLLDVLGVLTEPKLEKAPEPRLKALEAGPPGLRRRLPPGVVAELNGLDFPCDELSPPNRLGRVALRVEEGEAAGASPKPPREGLVLVDRESLLELWWGRDYVSANFINVKLNNGKGNSLVTTAVKTIHGARSARTSQ